MAWQTQPAAKVLCMKTSCTDGNPIGREMQQWSMKNFYIDEQGQVRHKRLDMLMDNFIARTCNPYKGEPTHG